MKALALFFIAVVGTVSYLAYDNAQKDKTIQNLQKTINVTFGQLGEVRRELANTTAALAAAQKKLEKSGIALAAAQNKPAPEPEPNYFAPEGIFFLTVKKSVETADGITGLRPGTRLRLQDDGSYRTDAGVTVQANHHEVTNDLRIAGQVLAADAAGIAALRAQVAEWNKAENEIQARHNQMVKEGQAIKFSPSAIPSGALNRPAYDEKRFSKPGREPFSRYYTP